MLERERSLFAELHTRRRTFFSTDVTDATILTCRIENHSVHTSKLKTVLARVRTRRSCSDLNTGCVIAKTGRGGAH